MMSTTLGGNLLQDTNGLSPKMLRINLTPADNTRSGIKESEPNN